MGYFTHICAILLFKLQYLNHCSLFKFFFSLGRIRELSWRETWYFVMKRSRAKLSGLSVFLANKDFILCQIMETDDLEI